MDIIDLSDHLSPHIDTPTTPDVCPAPVATRLTDIPAEPLTWIWPGWIPAGVLTILGGHVGDGKSTVIAAIAAALTTGATLPEDFTPRASNVLILSAEDDPARVIRPRLEANNADLDRVFILNGGDTTTNLVTSQRQLDLRRDAGHLRAIIEDHDIRLLVIDPLGSFLRHSDRASEGAIRAALQPLMAVVAGTGVAILGVMRVGKSGQGRQPAQRLVGSSAVPAIARSVIMIASALGDGEDGAPDRAILQVVKTNYALAPHPVELRMAGNGAVQWLGPASVGIDELAETASDRRLTHSERADAAAFLREYLAESSINAVQVLKQAKRLGFSEITIRRAKKDIGVVSYRDAVLRGFWMWRLPETPVDPAQPDPHPWCT